MGELYRDIYPYHLKMPISGKTFSIESASSGGLGVDFMPRRSVSYWPFLLVSTALHAFPVGGFILWGGEDVVLKDPAHAPTFIVEVGYENYIVEKEIGVKAKDIQRLDVDSPIKEMCQRKTVSGGGSQLSNNLSGVNSTIVPASGNEKPPYPLRALEEKIEGTVQLRLSIDGTGRVKNAVPLEPRAHPVLEKAALEGVRQWKYIVTGVVGEATWNVPIEFILDKE